MPSKEERERRRQERLEAERRELAAARRRLIFGYVTAGLLAAAVVVGLVIVVLSGGDDTPQVNGKDIPEAAHVQIKTGSLQGYDLDDRTGTPPPALQQGDLEAAADAAGCDLQLDLPDEGNTHLQSKSDTPTYKTNPPTSGDHWPEPLADGAYAEHPNPIYTVHSMEHGRVEIQYSPDLPEKDQLAIKGVFDEDPPGMLLFPNPKMPYDVAVTAWTQLLGCRKYEGEATLDAIRDFRDIYRGQGPESQIPVVVPNEG